MNQSDAKNLRFYFVTKLIERTEVTRKNLVFFMQKSTGTQFVWQKELTVI